MNFDKVHEEQEERVYTLERPEQRQQQQPKHEEPAKISMRAPLEITETLNRAIEVMNPESPMFKAVAELANYVDFEVVMTKKKSQNHYETNTHEDPN